MNILLTSVGRRSYLVRYFKEALHGAGKVHVSNSTNLTPAFAYADHYVVSPLIYDESYIPFLLTYCSENNIKVLLSLFDVDLPVLAENKHRFNELGVVVVVSDRAVIDICNDKYATFMFLSQNGFDTPKTYLSIDSARTAILNRDIAYPVVIKPRWGMGSIGVLEAEDHDELIVLYKKCMMSIRSSYLMYESEKHIQESVLIQEKLRGQEYGLDVINNLNGVYQNTIVKIKHAMRAGETDCAETANIPDLKLLGRKIANRLGHIANLDVDVFYAQNRYYVLEMNARFGGGYPFSHIAGINLPGAIIDWVEGKDAAQLLKNEKFGILSHKDIDILRINPIDGKG